MLLLFLFNVGGYNLLIWLARLHSEKAMATKIDSGTYDQSQTIELAIPINMPYPSLHEREYEHSKGKFEYKGEYYKLVKHRIENDTVYIVCIRDVDQKRMIEAINDYASTSNDFAGDDAKTANLLGKIFKDYRVGNTIEIPALSQLTIATRFGSFTYEILPGTNQIASPPPKL